MNEPINPTARQKALVIQELPGEVLVYDMYTNKAHCLNRSAALIWRLCDGQNTVMDIADKFESKNGKITEDFVWLALDQLSLSGLLETEIPPPFTGQSRRHVLKKIGLASITALPIIASLVAPSSILGFSSCACATPAQCNGFSGCPSSFNCTLQGICAP